MTVDVNFGVIAIDEAGYQYCDWPNEAREEDGTSPEFTVWPGQPRRCYSDVGWAAWLSTVPQMVEFIPDGDDVFIPLTNQFMKVINSLSENNTALKNDRAVWWKYWARRAREEFGDKAVVRIW